MQSICECQADTKTCVDNGFQNSPICYVCAMEYFALSQSIFEDIRCFSHRAHTLKLYDDLVFLWYKQSIIILYI